MLVSWLVTVIVLDDLVEEFVELGVRIVRAGIDTDSRVEVLHTREDASLEGNSLSAFLVLVLLPNFFSQAFAKLRRGSLWEESLEINELVS